MKIKQKIETKVTMFTVPTPVIKKMYKKMLNYFLYKFVKICRFAVLDINIFYIF